MRINYVQIWRERTMQKKNQREGNNKAKVLDD